MVEKAILQPSTPFHLFGDKFVILDRIDGILSCELGIPVVLPSFVDQVDLHVNAVNLTPLTSDGRVFIRWIDRADWCARERAESQREVE